MNPFSLERKVEHIYLGSYILCKSSLNPEVLSNPITVIMATNNTTTN